MAGLKMRTEYKITEIVKATGGKLLSKSKKETSVSELLLDSRKLIHSTQTLFFALSGQKLENTAIKALEKLSPGLAKLSEGITNLIIATGKSPLVKPDSSAR